MIFQNTFKNLQEKCNNMLEQCRNIVEENKNLTSQPTCACDIETETTTQDVSYNVFDFYQEMREELYGEKIDDSREAEFNKIISGELETSDALALSIIEAAKQDNYTRELSEEELSSFYDKLINEKIEGVNIDVLSDDDARLENLYEAQMNELTMKYLDKSADDCTPEELNQIYALSLVDDILASSQENLKKQDDSDGAISEIFDWLKETVGYSTCQKDVEDALELQKGIVSKLKTAIKNGNFEEVWQEVTGVEYDAEKIALYQEKTSQLEFLSMSIQSYDAFHEKLIRENLGNPMGMCDAYIEFFGKDKGEEKFCEMLKYAYNNTLNGFNTENNPIEKISFNEEGYLVFKQRQGAEFVFGEVEGVSSEILLAASSDKFKRLQIDNFIQELEKTTGINYTRLTQEVNTLSNEALGNANAVTNILNKYINSQEGFIDAFAGFTQLVGMATMVVGYGTACLIPGGQAVGLGIAKAGQGMAIAGTFGDEALEIVDKATNNNTFEEDLEEYKEILKEFMVDGALFASGYAIGSFANGIGDDILTKTGSKLLSKTADIGVDAALSLLSDMAITGEIDLTSEGINQFIGILTGTMMARMNATHVKTMDTATDILNTKGMDDAVSYLRGEGASNKTIKDFKINKETQRLNNEIALGKISPEIAATQLQEIGISKKALVQFQKAHGLEYRTPAQLMRDLVKKNGINEIFAKEAALDYKLSEAEAIEYSKYRENGMSAETAMNFIELDRLNKAPSRKYNSIDEVFADLEPSQKEFANELLASAESKGYGDFIRSHPDIFKGMIDTGINDLYNINYTKLSSEQWSIIKYIAEQVDTKTIPSEVYSAVDARIQGEIYYKLFDYIDNPEAIPPEGIPHPFVEGEYISRDVCIRRLTEEAIPLRDFLNTQSIPNEVKVTRSDRCSVFNNTTINGVNIGKLMSSGKPEDIQLALDLLNGNNCGINYKNFTGTSLYNTSDKLDGATPAREPEIIWDLTLPKGTKGAFLEAMLDSGDGAIYGECEFLLQTNSYYQISSVKYENGRYIISATVVQE